MGSVNEQHRTQPLVASALHCLTPHPQTGEKLALVQQMGSSAPPVAVAEMENTQIRILCDQSLITNNTADIGLSSAHPAVFLCSIATTVRTWAWGAPGQGSS